MFYAGLQGYDHDSPPALYIIGYFEVMHAGLATDFTAGELGHLFRNNFHVMHKAVFADQKDRLVLVKGGPNSRLLSTAARISTPGKDRLGRPLHELSSEMCKVFGDFGGRTSIQRSPPRWVAPELTALAAQFVRSLR